MSRSRSACREPIAPTKTGGSAPPPAACATAIESLWTSRPTNNGVDCAMADLREHNAAVHAALRLWPTGYPATKPEVSRVLLPKSYCLDRHDLLRYPRDS